MKPVTKDYLLYDFIYGISRTGTTIETENGSVVARMIWEGEDWEMIPKEYDISL